MLLPLDLKEDFDTFKRRGDKRHRDSGESPRTGDLADRERGVWTGVGGKRPDEIFAHVVAPETDGEHGCHAHQRRRDTGVETLAQTFPRDCFSDHVDGAGVNAFLCGLHADFDEVEGVSDYDGADSANAARCEGAQAGGGFFGGDDDFIFDVFGGGD